MLLKSLQFSLEITFKRMCWAVMFGLIMGIVGEFLGLGTLVRLPLVFFIYWLCYTVHWTEVPLPSTMDRWHSWWAEGKQLKEELDKLK